jgi:uncharacterized YccA/Bax inhibitor family protein
MSSNPIFGSDGKAFRAASRQYAAPPPDVASLEQLYQRPAYSAERFMTVDDVVTRTAMVLGTIVVSGAVAWWLDLGALALIGGIVGLVLGLVIAVKRSTSAPLIMTYAVCQGVFLGAISQIYETRFHGIVVQAVIGTAGVFAGMLAVYKVGAVRVTPKFNRWLTGALCGAVAVMLVNVVASLIVGHDALGIRSGGPIAIGFSLLCIGIAAAAFLSDFDMVDQALRAGTPEKFAWYAAFGLTVTLIWLYLEILRLIGYVRD